MACALRHSNLVKKDVINRAWSKHEETKKCNIQHLVWKPQTMSLCGPYPSTSIFVLFSPRSLFLCRPVSAVRSNVRTLLFLFFYAVRLSVRLLFSLFLVRSVPIYEYYCCCFSMWSVRMYEFYFPCFCVWSWVSSCKTPRFVRQKNTAASPTGPETKNDCAGEDQQQFTQTEPNCIWYCWRVNFTHICQYCYGFSVCTTPCLVSLCLFHVLLSWFPSDVRLFLSIFYWATRSRTRVTSCLH
jgi:hypothetical protein